MDPSGSSAVWRSLGGQVAHISFRSVVLGPKSALKEGSPEQVGVEDGGEGNSSVHGAIVQAVRCRFPNLLEGWSSERKAEAGKRAGERRQRRKRRTELPWSVCILRNPDLITVHHPSGHSYDVTLPCEARLLQPLGEGLLVQRHAGGEEDARYFSGALRGQDGMEEEEREDQEQEEDALEASPVPSLFTLSHPLDELRPVALLPPAVTAARAPAGGNRSGCGAGSSGSRRRESFPINSPSSFPLFTVEEQPERLVCDASERVVFARGDGAVGAGRDASLLLTYHAGRRRHSLWRMLPVPEPDHEPEPERDEEPDALGGGDVSVLGPMMDASPGGMGSLRAATGLSSTLAADASSLSSTLLGISALESSSSAAGLSMLDAGLTSGQSRRDRLSSGGRGRLSGGGGGGGGGAGRRVSTGSNASWVGPGNTRNEALASALGLGQSALGVASNMLSLSAAAGQGGGERGGGADPFPPSFIGGGLAGTSSMALGESQALEEEEEEDDSEGAQPIRPHIGLSLVWREAEDSPSPARHVFCAEAGASSGPTSAGSFLICLVEGDAERLRALSVSFPATSSDSNARATGDVADGDNGGGMEVAEAFTMPCSSAVGLCATTGSEGEGAPGGAIAADILALTPDRGLVLCRGSTTVTQVSLPEAPAAAGVAAMVAAMGSGKAPLSVVPDQALRDKPESVSDAVGSCFTLTTSSGHRRRLRLSLDPASPLVSACLGAWDSMLSASLSASLRADVVGEAHTLAEQTAPPAGPTGNAGGGVAGTQGSAAGSGGGGGGGLDLDWEALVSVMRNLVAGVDERSLDHWEDGLAGTGKGGGNTGGEGGRGSEGGGDGGSGSGSGDGGDEAWTRLLSSPFHGQFSRDHAMLLSGFRDAAGSTAQKSSRTPQGFAQGGVPEARSPLSPPRPLRTERAAFLAEAGAAFDALHLVLEDLKTSRLTVSLVPRLASLLLSLTRVCGDAGADMRDFSDHYWRDAAGCRQGGGSGGGGGGGETASMIARGKEGLLMAELGRDALPRRPTRFRKVRMAIRVEGGVRRPVCPSLE